MKIMTILGTRPEIIRLSLIINKLDQICEHVLVHTGQNYDSKLNDIFFEQMNVRLPDYRFNNQSKTFGQQIGKILADGEQVLLDEKPDRLLLLGDTNSSMIAIIAKRMHVPVYHMEAGNRCHDDRVPEEVNRRIIDHSSDILLPYTEQSRQNLIAEGIPNSRIFVTGNPINEVIRHYSEQINQSTILNELGLTAKKYFLVTMHREENVDIEERLRQIINGIKKIQTHYSIPVIVSTHPRTRKRISEFGLTENNKDIRYMEPFGFFDFINLEKNAFCLLSDSGTVQEECTLFGVPNVTLRDVTERPETLECGSNVLSGADPELIFQCVKLVVSRKSTWNPPKEYATDNVSDIVMNILSGYCHFHI